MPHLKLEYTSNIKNDINFEALFRTLHKTINSVAGIDINNFKSRAYKLDNYYVSSKGKQGAFVHLEVSILEGREEKLKRNLGTSLLSILEESFAGKYDSRELQITIELRDMTKNSYFKSNL